jgi:transposase InsO family protein
LNERTIKDAYALPRIEEILDCLAGSEFFTVLDMKSGYYQIEKEEEHKRRTAFTVGPLGFYEYNRLPFGLTNSPATYQRVMESVLGDLHLKACLIYLDDVIIFSRTYEEHVERLKQVFTRIREAGLKLAPKKCRLFQERVVYVGHQVSREGVAPDPDKTSCIRDWPTPHTPEDVRRFLGFAGYYRKFVKDFAKIASPLSALMPASVKKRRGRKKTTETPQKPWTWGRDEQKAFETLRDALAKPPILGYADFTRPFELHTDASALGLGAVLYQQQEGKSRVIAYASRSLGKAERNYPAHKLEFLALKWAVTEKLKDYLYGASFTVYTDNNPLTYVLTTAKLDATGHRWLAALAAFNFTLKYKPGAKNVDADTLSRLAHNPQLSVDEEREISAEAVHTICSSIQYPIVETLCMSADAVDDLDGQDLTQHRTQDVRRAQNSDPIIGAWMTYLRSGRKPKHRVCQHPEDAAMLRNFEHLRLKRGALYREVTTDGQTTSQLVLPSSLRKEALRGIHDDVGHPGRDRTMALAKERFWWPGMSRNVEDWVSHCTRCLKRKAAGEKAPLVNIVTTQPMELVCIDYLSLESSSGGYQHVLVITDHFTRYAQAIPTKNQTARITAEALMTHFVPHYGFPRRLHADQGATFESKVVRELCSLAGIEKSRTTPYHPMGNGMTERFNRTLLAMLGTLEPKQKAGWHKFVHLMTHAYNSTPHSSTGHSPFYLMFGRHPRLPVDIVFGIERNANSKSHTAYVADSKRCTNRQRALLSDPKNTRKPTTIVA